MYQNRMKSKTRLIIRMLAGSALSGCAGSAIAADAPKSAAKRPTLERFKEEHLQKTHQDAEAVRKARQNRG